MEGKVGSAGEERQWEGRGEGKERRRKF